MKGHGPKTVNYILPLLGLALAGVLSLRPEMAPGAGGVVPNIAALLAVVLLCGAAISAVAHADVVAARLGQPYGVLLLTMSVTIIEVSVMASMMLHGQNNPTLARESVFSVLMIVNTGIVGLCLLMGSLRHREQTIQQQGVSGYLSVMIALGVMLLVLPAETHEGETGTFSPRQLVFMSFVAVSLYGAFLYMQTVRYREHFESQPEGHGEPPPAPAAFAAGLVMLLLSLAAVVALSKHVAATFEDFLGNFALADPDAVTGALIALLILLPEGISAVRAAARNHLQHSLNIALGSALATVALTIPVMAFISVLIGHSMVLGLDTEDRTMLLVTFVLSILSFGTGRTNALNGVVHLIVFCVYVMLLFMP
ncbi:ionic transporter [Xanthobacter autotrophicus]|uniref:calcium:proton antiporter n=1 Tax=Xanthobacter TaxID=279 RepID=UPI0024AA761C|nr:ionic transporter [Xanthobacter autotrophicus]MDI4666705.1 ionic transporter [Xanthobacter autotrophicus]